MFVNPKHLGKKMRFWFHYHGPIKSRKSQKISIHFKKQKVCKLSNKLLYFCSIAQSCQWADQITPEPGPNPKMQAQTRPQPENDLKL